jgi:hypothetical protein
VTADDDAEVLEPDDEDEVSAAEEDTSPDTTEGSPES